MEAVNIHLGCGAVRLEGWINVDLDAAVRPDLVADLACPFPFADGCAVLIHAEGVMCQLDLDGGFRFLRECHRLLAPGGRVRLLTPDLAEFVRRYLSDYASGARGLVDLWLEGTGVPLKTATPCEVLNVGLRDYHGFMYDDATLEFLARECGFEPRKVRYRESEVPELRGVDQRSLDNAIYQYFELLRR